MDLVTPPLSPVTTALRLSPRLSLARSVRALEDAGTRTVVLEPDRTLSVAMGWTAMATRRLRPVVEASERHIAKVIEDLPSEVVSKLSPA
jgi:DNA-binding HxlR family transcriptional regulator